MTPARRSALVLLALPLLALAGCGGSDGGAGSSGKGGGGGTVAAEGAPEAQTATVVGNAKLAFSPSTVTAKAGSLALTLQIEGGVPHNLVFDEDTIGEDIATIGDGSATGTFEFPKAGTYDFVCTLHPGMDGKVVVS
ncbi:MAG: blue (type 1) copper domain protein [Frankiales bacterium]|nr:blue (type 1) copper domain protein [Frankiales bacterium]